MFKKGSHVYNSQLNALLFGEQGYVVVASAGFRESP